MAFNPKNYQFTTGKHQDKDVIIVHFPYNQLIKDELKGKFSNAKWNVSEKYWYLPDTNAIRNVIGMAPKTEIGKAVISKIHPIYIAGLML